MTDGDVDGNDGGNDDGNDDGNDGGNGVREELRELLEGKRAELHGLIDGLGAAEFERKVPGSAWNARQLAWHIGFSPRFFTRSIGSVRQGKNSGPPAWLFSLLEPVGALVPKMQARGATPQSVGAMFDEGTAEVLELLDGIREEEWERSALVLGQPATLEGVFREFAGHAEEHLAELRKALG